MEKRIVGLWRECDRLAAELTAIETGKHRECETGPDGEEVDISTVWANHLRTILAAKRALMAELQKTYDELDD